MLCVVDFVLKNHNFSVQEIVSTAIGDREITINSVPNSNPTFDKYMGLSYFCNDRILCKDFITSYLEDYGYTLEDQSISLRLS